MPYMGERRGAYRVLSGNVRERYNLEDTRRWGDNTKMDLKGTRCANVDRIVLLTFRHYFVVGTATALGAGQFVVPNDKLW